MRKRLFAIGSLTIASVVYAVYGQQGRSATSTPAAITATRSVVDQYCVSCHNEKAKAAGSDAAVKLTLDDKDLAQVRDHAEVWEKVVRKLRTGMMPPAGARRPDRSTLETTIVLVGK